MYGLYIFSLHQDSESSSNKPQPSNIMTNICHITGCIFVLFFRDLFNAAFVSCWTEMSEAKQDELAQNLEQALVSQEIPEIMQTLLNLAEFMEHCDKVRTHSQ